MRADYKIIDADRHVLEPMEMWKQYLPEAFHSHAPYWQAINDHELLSDRVARLGPRGLIPLEPVAHVNGKSLWHKLTEHARIELGRAAMQRQGQMSQGRSPEGHLAVMDQDGVDIAFFFPTYAHYLLSFDDMEPAVAAAYARAYNDWLADFCHVDPHRLRGVGVVSRHDPKDMLDELGRLRDAGFSAVVLRPNPVKGRILSDPAYEPFWQACARDDLAVCIHEGTHAHLPTTGADRFHTRFGMHACSHPMEQMMALLALIEGGVLERHPTLRVGFFEAGCGWLPYWLWRLDEIEYANLAGEVEANVRMKPSSYFRRQCFIAFEPDEPYLHALLDFIGADVLLFGTDFPHADHGAHIVEHAWKLAAGIPAEVTRKALRDNAARFFHVT